MQPTSVLETVIYASDLAEAEAFYRDVLGLVPFSKLEGRQLFYRLADQVLLIFNPDATERPPAAGALPVPPHGARGPGHICFKATAEDIDLWRTHLEGKGILVESDFVWPASGGRSIYFRDPYGNCLEFAEPRIWGFA
ncbi:MAG TPA: VOC family protein [Hyphomicrobiaceae bacterium]|nr:VOC family protein [Hyphomicrobiaceae bacterium]